MNIYIDGFSDRRSKSTMYNGNVFITKVIVVETSKIKTYMRRPKQYCLQLDIHHTVLFIRAPNLLLTILPILICGGKFL